MHTRRRVRRHVSRVLSPVAAVAAFLYFLIDAVFLAAVRTIIRPLARALPRLRIFNALAASTKRETVIAVQRGANKHTYRLF
jgi:hypothetical protein